MRKKIIDLRNRIKLLFFLKNRDKCGQSYYNINIKLLQLYNKFKDSYRNMWKYLRLSFFYCFLLRLTIIYVYFGGFIEYRNAIPFWTRIVHYWILLILCLCFVYLIFNFAATQIYRIITVLVFPSIYLPSLYKFNIKYFKFVGFFASVITRILSYHLFIPFILIAIASYYKNELWFELVFTAFFIRTCYNFIINPIKFKTILEALIYCETVLLKCDKNINQKYKNDELLRKTGIRTFVDPTVCVMYSDKITVIRPFIAMGFYYFLKLLSYIVDEEKIKKLDDLIDSRFLRFIPSISTYAANYPEFVFYYFYVTGYSQFLEQ
jgi:hypothetical protein